jgi:eukaryotic-like serine/threonine-protein kinase
VEEPCLSDDTVLDFVAGRLDEAARADAERHLGHCLLCNRLVAVAAGYQQVGPANDLTASTENGSPAWREPARGSALPLGTELRDTYRLARLVGRGGMGEVFEATHARLPGRFAVKVLHAHCIADPKAIVRFRREAEITSGLRHPNIVAIIDFDYTPAGAPYLVMEYLEGGELARIIAEEAPLAIDRVLRIVDQVASALTAVHRKHIVHRDLKPQNIFLVRGQRAGEEHVKLCDFGISKVRAASVALTGERVLLGTPQYMAPEQARGTGEVDARADQFALAAIIYEMLTGRLAFPGDRVEIVVYRISHEAPKPLGPPWGPALAATLDRALAKDPDLRFPSVQEFAEALRAAAEKDRPWGTPEALSRTTIRGEAEPRPEPVTPSTIPPAVVTIARRRAVMGGAGVAVALVVGAVILARGKSSAPPSGDEIAVPESRAAAVTSPPVPSAVVTAPTQEPTKPQETPPKHAGVEPRGKKLPARAEAERPAPTTRVRESKRGSLIDRL